MNSEHDFFSELNNLKEYFYGVLFPSSTVITSTNLDNISNYFFNLSDEALNNLINIHFLISDEVESVIPHFKDFLINVERTTLRTTHESSYVRGQIDWGQTIKMQAMNVGMPIFASKLPQRQFDTPYNQVVKYMLTNLKNILRETKKINEEEGELIKINPISLREKFIHLGKEIDKILYSPIFKQVTLIPFIPQAILESLKGLRHPLYKSISQLYALYKVTYIKRDLSILGKRLFNKILISQDLNKLLEFIVLFKTAKKLDEINKRENGKSTLEVLGYNSESFATYLIKNTKVTLRYQKITRDISVASKYTDYLKRLGMANVRSRMPDILLSFETENELRHVLIEVKNSSRTDYILDSIYKMYGYINDFQQALLPNEVQGILVVRSGVNNPIYDLHENLWTINYGDLDNALTKLSEQYIQ